MKWMEIVGNSTDQKVVLDIPSWLSRGALDAIGQGTLCLFSRDTDFILNFPSAAFDVQFGAVKDETHPLVKVYKNMLSVFATFSSACKVTLSRSRHDIFGRPSAQQIFLQAVSRYIPARVLEWITDHWSHRRIQRAWEVKRVATEVARQLVHEKAESLLAGKGTRDIFSLLGRPCSCSSSSLLNHSQSRPIWMQTQRTS